LKFSIIVPVYNTERFLRRALDSLMSQSYSNFEVIVINDGSEDNSADIVTEFCLADSRFTCYTVLNGGLGRARNIGLSYASGDYIVFLDSDDWLDDDYLLNSLSHVSEEVVVIQNRRFHRLDNVATVKYPKKILNFFNDINISCTNKIFPRELTKGLAFTEGKYFEDIEFYVELLVLHPRFVIGDSFYNVEKRNEKSITSGICKKHIDLVRNLDKCSVFFCRLPVSVRRDFQFYSFKSAVFLIYKLKESGESLSGLFTVLTLPNALKGRSLLRAGLYILTFVPEYLIRVISSVRNN